MGLKILLADPSSEWLVPSKEILKQSFFEVEVVNNGKDAQIAVAKGKLFAVVMNAEIQNFTVGQVLKFIKSNQAVQKILITVSSMDKLKELELTEEDLIKMGATEVITYRPNPSQLKKLIEGHQGIQNFMTNMEKRSGQSDEVEISGDESKFTAIPIDDFFSAKNVLFDVYIKLGSSKFLKILHTGDTFTRERLDKYKSSKGITHLYISTDDRQKFINWNNVVASMTVGNDKVSAEKKVSHMKSLTDKFVEEIYTEGLKPQMVEQGKLLSQNTMQMIEKEKNLYKVLRTLQDMDPNAYSHSYMVSLFSSMVVKQFEWQSMATIESITLASMLHDIGKVKLPKELLTKTYFEMTPEEIVLWKEHPKYSAEYLENNRQINQSVKQIVIQHHEMIDGSGFPFGLRDSNMLTLSKIVSFVNDFINIITYEKITPVEGLRKVLSDSTLSIKYNPFVLENFSKVFIDPDKIKKKTELPSNSVLVPKKAG